MKGNQTNSVINRIAISVFFFTYGFGFSNAAARYPELIKIYNTSDFEFGGLLFCVSLAAIIGATFSNHIISKYGSKNALLLTMTVSSLLYPIPPLFSDIYTPIPFLFLYGTQLGVKDIAMNTQAVYTERIYHKPLLSSFYAIFSVGTALGAVSSGLFVNFKISFFYHLLIITLVCFAMMLWAINYVMPDEKPETLNTNQNAGLMKSIKLILPLGIIAFCGTIGDSAMSDWSARYMSKIFNQSDGFSTYALSCFTAGMCVGRFAGDYMTTLIGKGKLLLCDNVLAIAGLATILLTHNPYSALAGFFVVGLGVATIIPIVYSIAGNTEGVFPSVGISIVTIMGYIAFLVTPLIIGFLADAYSLKMGFAAVLSLFLITFPLTIWKK